MSAGATGNGRGPVMVQDWLDLLFLHWPVPPEHIAPLLPPGLQPDLFDGRAWVGVTPFTVGRLAPPAGFPNIIAFHELNARTYVHDGEVPGVWFFSLDATSGLAVAGARAVYRLPYFRATIERDRKDGLSWYRAVRAGRAKNARPSFEVRWRTEGRPTESRPGSLETFLVERYALYAASRGRLLRVRIEHPPWILRPARVMSISSGLLQAAGLAAPEGPPLAHASEQIGVKVWLPHRIAAPPR